MEECEQGASAAAFEFEDDLFVSDLFLRDIINSPGTNAPSHAHTTSKMMSV